MKKTTKRLLLSAAVGVGCLLLTGCTKSFCSVQDKAEMIAVYAEKNLDSINEKAVKNNILLPQQEFLNYIEEKVTYYTQTEECHKDKEGNPLVSFARYAGYVEKANGKKKAALFANYDNWYVLAVEELGIEKCPSASYVNFYKKSLLSGISGKTSCITPEDGKFGLTGNEVYVEGKTWGEAFKDYGFLEGLLVYPISWLLHSCTKAFGTSGGGQLAAILIVTLIIRLIVFAITLPATMSQNRMTEIQPELAALQDKYPSASTNQMDKQAMAREQMALYKKHHIHPVRQLLFMIPQFIIFVCVWSALQGSAILTQGTVFNLQLTRITRDAIFSGKSETPFAIILFLLMAVAQCISSLLPQWFQKWKEKTLATHTVKVQENKQQKSMKMMSYVMVGFIIIMGLTLPAAMAFYWFVGALFTIIQTLIMEAYNSKKRHRNNNRRGGSSTSWSQRKKENNKKSAGKFSIRKG